MMVLFRIDFYDFYDDDGGGCDGLDGGSSSSSSNGDGLLVILGSILISIKLCDNN